MKASKRTPARSRSSRSAHIPLRELAVIRRWALLHHTGAPRWLTQMHKAGRLVAAATWVHGSQRYDLIVEAAKIMVALREPRTQDRVSFRKSQWEIEVAIGRLGGCAGCLAGGYSLADKRVYACVERAVNAADPIGLLHLGANDDEYRPEIDDIACWLSEVDRRTLAQTQAMIHRVFVTWFGERVAGFKKHYRSLAKQLHRLRRASEAPKPGLTIIAAHAKTLRTLAKR